MNEMTCPTNRNNNNKSTVLWTVFTTYSLPINSSKNTRINRILIMIKLRTHTLTQRMAQFKCGARMFDGGRINTPWLVVMEALMCTDIQCSSNYNDGIVSWWCPMVVAHPFNCDSNSRLSNIITITVVTDNITL